MSLEAGAQFFYQFVARALLFTKLSWRITFFLPTWSIGPYGDTTYVHTTITSMLILGACDFGKRKSNTRVNPSE